MIKESDKSVGNEVHEVILERLRFYAKEIIPKEMLMAVNIDFLKDRFSENAIFSWKAAIAGQGLRTIRYPKDWWQAFKERWFPKSFKKWWPIEYKIIDIYALYPKIAMPKQFTGIHILERYPDPREE